MLRPFLISLALCLLSNILKILFQFLILAVRSDRHALRSGKLLSQHFGLLLLVLLLEQTSLLELCRKMINFGIYYALNVALDDMIHHLSFFMILTDYTLIYCLVRRP